MSKIDQCPYLIYKTSNSCASCTGYRCTSQGREKKIDSSQLETCKDVNEYVECTRYIETLPVDQLETLEKVKETISYDEETPYFELPEIPDITLTEEPTPIPVRKPCGCGNADVRASSCPYQGPTPVGCTSCLGIWCYGNNKNIRVDKNCVNWKICSVFAMSKYKGVKFYRDR